MRILLTNDDGIRAPGIQALYYEIVKLGEVHTIAPATVQSATSHGVTFHEPLMVQPLQVNEEMRGVAVEGRPADCVKLAITSLWEERYGGQPDLVISGMNAGTNVGIHIIYSGTIGAAIEGAFLGLPAFAVSLHFLDFDAIRWKVAARHAREAIEKCLEHREDVMRPHSVLNINLPLTEGPDIPEDAPRPSIRVVPMNLSAVNDQYDKRTSPSGNDYYWITGDGLDFNHTSEGSDVEALFAKHIVVTPLQYDLTDHGRLDKWRNMVGEQDS
ncbi:MAG: 5'/3'-nucleotidase SurE [Planctomycetes bacterium]|nr:5'/3'-nucleotidase SurE [Planctomycetota bacterium]